MFCATIYCMQKQFFSGVLQVGDELQKKKTEHLFCNAKCGIL